MGYHINYLIWAFLILIGEMDQIRLRHKRGSHRSRGIDTPRMKLSVTALILLSGATCVAAATKPLSSKYIQQGLTEEEALCIKAYLEVTNTTRDLDTVDLNDTELPQDWETLVKIQKAMPYFDMLSSMAKPHEYLQKKVLNRRSNGRPYFRRSEISAIERKIQAQPKFLMNWFGAAVRYGVRAPFRPLKTGAAANNFRPFNQATLTELARKFPLEFGNLPTLNDPNENLKNYLLSILTTTKARRYVKKRFEDDPYFIAEGLNKITSRSSKPFARYSKKLERHVAAN